MALGFTIINNDLLEDKELNIQEQGLLVALISFYNKEKGYSYPNYKQLMLRSKIKKDDTLIKVVKSLIDKGYIEKEFIKGIGCKYYLLKHCSTSYTAQMGLPLKEGYPKEEGTPTPNKGEHLPHKRGITNTNTNTNTNTDERTNKIKKNFSKIISLYPGKKVKCIRDKKLPKLIETYGEEQLTRCVKRYADECKGKDKQYILNESTFWNGRYMDYLDSAVSENPAVTGTKRCTPNFKFIDL